MVPSKFTREWCVCCEHMTTHRDSRCEVCEHRKWQLRIYEACTNKGEAT